MSADLVVQCSKLIEWLLARRVIPEDYTKLLTAVQARVSEAHKENISDEVSRSLISRWSDEVHYFAAKKIYEAISKSPEGQAKSLLGGHTHPGAAKWKAVMDAYRKRHLGWASAARFLIQNVSYELTALTKHATSCEKQVQECAAKQAELDRQEVNAKTRYRELLNDLGIEGFDVRGELRQRAKQDLRLLSEDVLKILREVGEDAAQCYQVFAEHAAGRPLSEEVLPFLRALSTPELEALEVLEEKVPSYASLRLEKGRMAAEVELVPEVEAPTTEVEARGITGMDGIDWGITCDEGGDASGGINWDFEVQEEVTSVEPEASGGIDWGAVSFEGFEIAPEVEVEAQIGAETETILLVDAAARELLAREVAEALAFLIERYDDLAQGGATREEYGPKIQQSLGEVETLRDQLSKLETLLSARRTQRLVLLASSQRYLERTVKRVEVAKMQCGKPTARKAELEKVKADQVAEASRSRAEAQQLIAAIKEVREDLEAELSAHFKSTVRILNACT